MLSRPGFDDPRVGEHHPERLSAQALRQREIKDGEHASDNSQSHKRGFSRNGPVYHHNKSEERDRANGYRNKVGDKGYNVAEYRSALVAHQLAGQRLIYLSDLRFEVIDRIDL